MLEGVCLLYPITLTAHQGVAPLQQCTPMLRNVKERGVRYIFDERLERKKNKAAMKSEPGKTGGGGGGGELGKEAPFPLPQSPTLRPQCPRLSRLLSSFPQSESLEQARSYLEFHRQSGDKYVKVEIIWRFAF